MLFIPAVIPVIHGGQVSRGVGRTLASDNGSLEEPKRGQGLRGATEQHLRRYRLRAAWSDRLTNGDSNISGDIGFDWLGP